MISNSKSILLKINCSETEIQLSHPFIPN